MPDITPDHPAVEALGSEGFDHEGGTMHAWRCENPDRYPGYCTCPEEAVAIVRDTLTADDLRDTSVGRGLMAEAWEEATLWIRYRDGRWPQDMEDANPYEETPDDRL